MLSNIVTTTSGNGLVTSVMADYNGDASVDRTRIITLGADGSQSAVSHNYGRGYNLQQTITTSISADGWTFSQLMDLNGDGYIDRGVTSQTDLSQAVTTTYEDFALNGIVEARIVGTLSANGMHSAYTFDIDGDGDVDLTRATDVTYDATGNEIVTFTETFGATNVTYEEVTTTTADGLTSTTTLDIDGDGVIDGTAVTEITLNDDGSRLTVSETHYADGDLRSRNTTFISADARTISKTYDYDGNGIDDKVVETVINSDGGSTRTETSFGEGGARGQTFVTTTSADGLVSTILRSGNLQTITRFAVDNGSYVWDNGVTPALDASHYKVSHSFDALGIETWTSTKTREEIETYSYGDPDKNNTATRIVIKTTTKEVRLDGEAKQRLLAEAERIYDTILDRDLDFNEVEILIEHISDGQLDMAGLTSNLMASGEFNIRYGTMSDAEFVTQLSLNAFGRTPSLTELDTYLRALDDASLTREQIALEISESIEHVVVGNGHMSTNNFDVIMNPAVFERSLDEAYARSIVENIVDVVYDRAATEQELSYLSDRLLTGEDTPDEIAALLLGVHGAIQGVSSASLMGLSGAALVEQAFINTLGRQPTAQEQLTWEQNLSSGRITTAQFVASLAQSAEHLAVGNTHVTNALPEVVTQTGTAAGETLSGFDFFLPSTQDILIGLGGNEILSGGGTSDTLIGGTGDDELRGWVGNDTYIWSRGDGNDTINDVGASVIEADTLELTDVALTRVNGSNHLLVTIISTGEVITVTNRFQSTANGYGIEAIEFSDGVTWALDDILAQTRVEGTAGDDVQTYIYEYDDGLLIGTTPSTDYTLYGTSYRDNIYGLDGNDVINGNDGDDTLVGGTGADTLNGGNGVDTASYLQATQGVNVDLNISTAQAGNAGGEEVGDILSSIENLEGSVYGDILTGNDNSNDLWGLAGDDTLNGQDGYDRLYGGAGNDILSGGLGADLLLGGDGNDQLYGSFGDDTLTGNFNADTFVFADGFGADVITDFAATNNFERIDLSSVTVITDYTDLATNHMNQVGSNVVIDAGGGNTITLTEVSLGDLDANDFVF